MNADPAKTHHVQQLVVFGSYLDPERDRLGDLDVAIDLVRAPGVLMIDYRKLPAQQRRVFRRLSGGRRAISFIELPSHREWLEKRRHREVFQDPLPARV